ncbi:MBG domain-containing protein [Dyella mobilis]|uniref:Filamentous hemagglutinin N-terminal domain-containing protein n=3 Tax=Dyella mobilis TaxID=1849582 RepID=A0ABS2KJS5_9GAMM|nr:filamentous hemagglutinin N-terminal domain-containing protein [Dyella mobilis]
MNHIYRLVWSQLRRTWLVVSELARGRGKAGRTLTPRRACSAWWAALPLSLPMLALAAAPAGITAIDTARPTAAIVAAGPALAPTVIASVASSAHPTEGQVTAGSGSIDYGDHLTTIQQHSQNLSLNWLSFNIGAQDTVNFVQPNAQAIAVNRIADPNGSVILGHLNANGQVFLINPNGVLFGQGAQVNVGGLVASTLDVSDDELGRGTLHFAGASGGSVTNRATITAAPGGYVALLGHAVSNQGAIHVPAGSVALAGGSAVTLSFDGNHLLDMQIDASTMNALAENKQLIVADGGQVLMSAGAKDSLLASVVNNTGTIQAQTVENRAGKIVLLGGMEAGTTQTAGTLDASAPNGGDGGFIETSAAHVHVADDAKISTLSASGNSGTWLIDPHDFTIAVSGGDMSGNTLSSQLLGGNITILSSKGANASGSGDIIINDAVAWSANTLTLTAAHDVDINAVMTAAGSAGLALNPSTANGGDAAIGGGTVKVNMVDAMPGQGGRVDFTGSSNTLQINGQPYTIITTLGAPGSTTGTDLQGINGALNCACYFALGANIDASATANWGNSAFGSQIGSGFVPIGHQFNPTDFNMFAGTFDGLGHTISGLTINLPGSDNVGLFGYTSTTATIRNVGLVGISIEGESDVGGLVGYNYGTISQAYAIGAINGNGVGANAGGLVGFNDSARISQAYASGAVSGPGTVGGLIGYNNRGSINQAYATATVSSSGGDVGGLIGINDGGPISQAYATGTVSGSQDVGGLLGYNIAAPISQAYATGAVSGTGSGSFVGGLVGDNGGTTDQAYATGAVSGSGNFVGGLDGANSAGAITNSYWDTETTGQSTSGNDGIGGGTGLTTKALIAALPGGFTAASWGNVSNQTTPYLLGMSGNQVFNTNDLPIGAVTRTNQPNLYTVILDVNQLQAVSTGLTGRYVLGNDIDASATLGWEGVEFDANGKPHFDNGFTPIGGPGAPFTGVFDGLGHTIDNLTINRPLTNYVGLFGITGNGSTIRNLGLLGGSITGQNYVGGLVGYNNGTISRAYVTSSVSGGGYVGGLVGDNGGTITNTYATGEVDSSGANDVYYGGLAGYNDAGGTITNAYATGAVYGSEYVGGLAGDNLGAITNAYATGAVNGSIYVGGLVGYLDAGGTIANTYATGAVSGGGSYFGGLVGVGAGNTIIDSYWDTQTTGQSTSAGGTGLTTAQMMDPASFAAWGMDISAIGGSSATWRIYAGDTAPLLRTFMVGLTVTAMNLGTIYNGTAFAGSSNLIFGTLTPGYWLPSNNVDTSLILGDANASTSTPATNAGSYALAANLYSRQMGYDIEFTPGTLIIAPALLTYQATSASSTYGSTPSGLTGTVTGFVNGQTLANATTGTASFTTGATANSNVGNYAIDGSGLTANDGNYTFTQAAGNATALTVSPATLTYQATSASSTYGSTPSGLTGTVTGFVNGQTLANATTGTASFTTGATATSNVGNYAIDGNGLTANDGNYTFTQAAGNATALTVSPATLTYQATSASSTYGSTPSGLTGTVTGFVNGQTLANATTGTASFTTGATATSNVGNYAIDGNGLTANDGNYTFTQAAGNATALTVSPATLTITANNDSKTYDGLAYAGGHGVTYSGFVNGETSSVLGGTLGYTGDSQGAINAGGYTITPDGLTAGNYAITYKNGNLTVDQATLEISSSNVSKTYDGGLSAIGTAVVSGGTLFGSDTLSGGNFAFTDKNVGTGKHVTVNGVTVSDGNGGRNYAVTYVDNTSSTITARSITVDATGTNRVYDGTTADAVKLASTGILAGDTVIFSGTGAFADKNVGTGKAVSVSGIAASGADAGNYSFNTTANTTADISPLSITVDATGTNRVYDGTTVDAVNLASSGILTGDTVAFRGTGAFADKNVGTSKAVSVSGITATGIDAGNYSFNTSATTTADITPATLTYRADTAHFKIGQMPGDLSGVVTGLVGGDTLDAATDGTLAWQTPATATSPAGAYAIDGSGLSAHNYVFVQASSNATALQVIDGSAPRLVVSTVAGLQQSDDSGKPRAPYAPDVHIVNGGVRLP